MGYLHDHLPYQKRRGRSTNNTASIPNVQHCGNSTFHHHLPVQKRYSIDASIFRRICKERDAISRLLLLYGSLFSLHPLQTSISSLLSCFRLHLKMHFATLLTFVAAVSASPVERQTKRAVLPLRQVTNVTSVKNILDRGTARLNKINGIAKTTVGTSLLSSGTITNELVSYVAPVIIGGKTWELIVDTGRYAL